MFTVQENGWHSAYTKARFALDGDLEVFFKVFYTPGGDVPLAERQTIMDVFTSRVSRISIDQIRNIQEALDARGYDPGHVDGQMGRRTRQAIRQFQIDEELRVDGKLTHALLHILTAEGHPSAVEMAQLKLTKLGYNPGPVNGQMGRRTRQAIQQFQQDQGLATDGILSCDLLGKLAYLCDPSITAETKAKHPPVTFMSEQIALRNQLKAKIWPNHVRRP
jgi:peptidoglycan hydrolase-like protein with peptidoglycan-binding domain